MYAISVSSHGGTYEPPSFCDCGYPIAIAQAWTDYYPVTKTRACKVFMCYDKQQTHWQKDIILKFKWDNEKLEAENKILKNEVARLNTNDRKMKSEVVMLKMKQGGGRKLVVRGGSRTLICLILFIVLVKILLM